MSRSRHLAGLCAVAFSAAALPAAAHADISVVNGPFITANGYNGFEGIGAHSGASVWTGPYTEGGITVEHVGGNKVVTIFQAEGQYSWYDGSGLGGYTDITAANHGAMDQLQFDATSQLITPIGAQIPFYYQLLLGGQVVATGSAGALCDTVNVCFHTYGFEGGQFDEVRIQANLFLSAFDANTPYADTLLIDNVFMREVPEPASWALMIAGLGAVGLALRRRSGNAAVSFA